MTLSRREQYRWEVNCHERESTHTLVLTGRPNGTLGAAFMIAGTYAQGDLPIIPDDHWTLVKEVYCCEGGHFKVAEHPEGPATVNELLGYPQSFACGQVNGMLNLTAAYLAALNNAPPTAPAFTLSGPPAGVGSHCVVITGPITVSGEYHVLPI